jgi:hypothetical protein
MMNGGKKIGLAFKFGNKAHPPYSVSIASFDGDFSVERNRHGFLETFPQGFVDEAARDGLTVLENTSPDYGRESVDKPISARVVYKQSGGQKLWTEEIYFFSDKDAFVVCARSEDQAEFDRLCAWAKTVKPKTSK